MRLADYISPGVLGTLTRPPTLPFIDRFVFGEQYSIEQAGRAPFVIPDLEVVLSIIYGEFTATPGYHPVVDIGDLRVAQGVRQAVLDDLVDALAYGMAAAGKSGALGKADRRVLYVTAQEDSNFLAPPPGMLGNTIDLIRSAVTMYNLTGSWDQMNRSNL